MKIFEKLLLRPCPFCDSKDVHIVCWPEISYARKNKMIKLIRHRAHALCYSCDAESCTEETQGTLFATEDAAQGVAMALAAAAWNRRAPKSQELLELHPDLLAEVEAA